MSVVPLNGPARLLGSSQPRQGHVEFTGGRFPITLPIRAAYPVLSKARDRDDLHPSVRLLAWAAFHGMQLVAKGKFQPSADHSRWEVAGLDENEERAIAELASARAAGTDFEADAAAAEGLVRAMIAAVVDAMPTEKPDSPRAERNQRERERSRNRAGQSFQETLESRLSSIRAAKEPETGLVQLVSISLRMEADEEELLGGSVRLVLQVHDDQNPLHVADAAVLWAENPSEHGFGSRARDHLLRALHLAASAWPVLDRLVSLQVPDEITLDTEELVSLLDHGLAALSERGVDVLFPRSLGRDLKASASLDRIDEPRPREDSAMFVEPLQQPLLGTEALFAFKWQVALDGEPLTDAEMDQLATAATPLVKLRGNWMIVDPAMARKAKKRLIRRVKPAEAVAAALTGVTEVADSTEQVVVGASLLKVRERLMAAPEAGQVPVPDALDATLRGYQLQGLSWLAELTGMGLGGVLADDMGLGKTITLISLHLHRHQRLGVHGPTLVVCPASLLGNWEREIRRFAPGVPVRRFHGSQRDLGGLPTHDSAPQDSAAHDGTAEQGADDGFVLTTYGTMRVDAEALGRVAWDLVVADEAQHVKNARSSTARALRTLDSHARVALTGTPVENELAELWAILDWVIPGLLGSLNAFRKAWAAPIESGIDPTRTRLFADLIRPFLMRRRKSDPGIAPELPEKTETDHIVGLTTEQAVLYEAFVRDSMDRIERSEPEERRGLVLRMLTGLKQICNHPAHFLKQSNPRLSGRSEKLELLDELIGTVLAEDGRALVFTQYVAMGNLLERHLAKAGIEHQFLHGSVPVAGREAMVDRFQSGSVPVFLLSLKAGGTGLNLTAADHVIHFDRWWNPAVEDQATDRAHRIGQTQTVQVHRMITQGTVEERIAELLTRKRGLAEAVLGRGEAALTELSNAELRDLVELRR